MWIRMNVKKISGHNNCQWFSKLGKYRLRMVLSCKHNTNRHDSKDYLLWNEISETKAMF